MPNLKSYYTVPELSKLTGVAQSTLYDWVREGDIESKQVGKGKKIRIPVDVAKYHFPEIESQ